MRFTLTAGQKGDAPQAAALIEGLPAEVVMADTAYDADHLRQAIAAKGALAVIPNNPSRALKYPLDKHLYAQRHRAISWNAASQSSSSSAASQPASKRPLEITGPSSLSQPSSYGCDKCPHHLVVPADFDSPIRRFDPCRPSHAVTRPKIVVNFSAKFLQIAGIPRLSG